MVTETDVSMLHKCTLIQQW